jgi:hypothetical protein
MKTIMTILFILAAGCLAFYAVCIYISAMRRSRNPEISCLKEKREVALERLAGIWTHKGTAESSAEKDEGETRKETEKSQDETHEISVAFRDPDLNAFYIENIRDKAGFSPQVRQVAEGILETLDREGDCPSVVNSHGEIEASLETGVYNRLARVTLREHALDTAKAMLRLVDPGPMTPMAIIAALGHDLGKIPAYRQQLYSLGDHPVISVTILDKIPGFSEMPNKGDVITAIRDHHRKPIDFFSIKLKEADQEARKKELARNFSLGDPGTGRESLPREEVEPRRVTSAMETIPRDDENKTEDRKRRRKPREVELPWYDGKAILQEIAGRVNKVDEGRWEAFSMANGYVYVQVGLLWSVTKKVARINGDPSVLIADSDEELRTNILYSIVERLKTEENAIARGLIRDGYFSAPFVVTMRDGTVHSKASYVPFNLEALGMLPSELESQKYGKVREIVDVTPKW